MVFGLKFRFLHLAIENNLKPLVLMVLGLSSYTALLRTSEVEPQALKHSERQHEQPKSWASKAPKSGFRSPESNLSLRRRKIYR